MEKSLSDKKSIVIALHVFGWICFLFYPFVLGAPFREELFYKLFFHSSLLAAFFYLNIFILIPQLLSKGKTGLYFTSILLITAAIVTIIVFFNQIFEIDIRQFADHPAPRRRMRTEHLGIARDLRRISRPFFSALFIFAVSTSYKLLWDWSKNEKRKKEIENETLHSELSFLKSQISPHFLFNTLNNIYSLSLTHSEKTSDAIMKLSQLLRYMLYEVNTKEAPLDKELEYIQTYIDLQKIRLRNDIKISFQREGNFSGKMIEPMLLIPFIENAFKHGINYSLESYIDIGIKISGSTLLFKIINSNHKEKDRQKDKASGIGLQNVQRRLKLLYPERHLLTITDSGSEYMVELKIQLQ